MSTCEKFNDLDPILDPVVLPYHPQRFRADQAAAAGRWEDRYDRVMGACADLIVVSEQTAPSGPAVFEYANHLVFV